MRYSVLHKNSAPSIDQFDRWSTIFYAVIDSLGIYTISTPCSMHNSNAISLSLNF